ncbi:MAG: hypothetical protein IH907_05135 [Proteobacteria bacterium]|nr:hypothetical protein [Pseudomonadota bacterium]
MRSQTVFVALLLAMLIQSAYAILKGSSYEKSRGTELTQHYIYGVAQGIRISSIINTVQGRAPIYCPPDNNAPGVQDYIEIFEKKYFSIWNILFVSTCESIF